MSFLGNYVETKITEATLSRDMIRQYVLRLFKRPDFPEQIFISLGDSAVVSKGDVVWLSSDCEHPYDWIPLPRIDELVLNLPTKEIFLRELGVARLEDVTLEAETRYWNGFAFDFANHGAGVKLTWK